MISSELLMEYTSELVKLGKNVYCIIFKGCVFITYKQELKLFRITAILEQVLEICVVYH